MARPQQQTQPPQRNASRARPADLTHPQIAIDYGIDKPLWNALRNLYPAGQDASLVMVFEYCTIRKLDPLKKPVHIVPIYNSDLGSMVDVIMPGIQEMRTTAARTGEYAGMDPPVLGPDVTIPITNSQSAPADVFTMTVPSFVTTTVYRLVQGKRYPFTHTEFFVEAVARKRDGLINEMWQKRPIGQLSKCSEAGALRKAFPEELGGEYSADEMEGREELIPQAAIVDGTDHGASGIPGPEAEPQQEQAEPAAAVAVSAEAEVVHTPAKAHPTAEQLAQRDRAVEEQARNAAAEAAEPKAETPADKRRATRAKKQAEQVAQAAADQTQVIPREVVEAAKAEAAAPKGDEAAPAAPNGAYVIDLPEGAGKVLRAELAKRGVTEAQLLAKLGADLTIANINQGLSLLKVWN